MRNLVLLALLVTLSFPVSGCHSPTSAPRLVGPADSSPRFQALVAEFIDWYLADVPEQATSLGVHVHDSSTRDFSAQAFTERSTRMREWLADLELIQRANLQGNEYDDYRILEYQLRGALLEIDEVRSWQKDPRIYSDTVSNGLSTLSGREFAPLQSRITAIVARLAAFAPTYAAARKNLIDVPPLWVDLAVQNAGGTVSFLQDDLPQALEAQGYDDLPLEAKTAFESARSEAIAATEAYVEWIDSKLRTQANGDFRLGKALFEEKLLYDEHFALSCEELRDRNEEAIAYYQAWVKQVAATIDPEKPPAAVMASVTSDFPKPDRLIATAEALVRDAQAFVIEQAILPLPSDALPTIRPTPPYLRLTFASMDAPGPFEGQATEAYYNITNVDPDWSIERQNQHLTYFNFPGLLGISVHEAVPGHFTHGLFHRKSPSKLRQIFVPNSLSEGWAHYVEQMMLDQGFGDGDPKLRLGQLRRALQRHARWYAGVAMHCFGESVAQAADRFQEIAFFADFPALREVQRGTSDATYLYYALGRMEILRLRESQQEKPGFDLSRFHEELLTQGLPLPLYEDWLGRKQQ